MTNHNDLRHLLDGAARREGDEEVEATVAWERGRRRRARKRVGASAVAGVMGLAVVGIVWQTGVFGGTAGPQDGLAATFPANSATFVFVQADSDVVPEELSSTMMSVPEATDLAGTTWELQERLWRSDRTVVDVIGSAAETQFSVADDQGQGWGVDIEGCGAAWVQRDLALGDTGSFRGEEIASTDIGCAQDVQTAEDFWMEVLLQGGTIHELDGGTAVLLVSIPGRGADDPVGVTEAPSEEPGVEPTEPTEPPSTPTEDPEDPAPVEPTEPPAEPTQEPTESPSTDPTTAPSPTEAPTNSTDPDEDLGGPWTPADEQTRSDGGLAAGGPLLAPELRAGAHDGFDRIVLDLTEGGPGEGAADVPGWVAAYPDGAVLDASGQPAQVGGDSLLEVIVSGMAYPEAGDPIYDAGTLRLDTPGLGVVVEAVRTVPFEGQLKVLVGMTGEPRPYRVMVLEGPMRVVIDVQR